MGLKAYLDPFQYKGFTSIYLAYAISKLGDWIYLIGFSLWLYDLTQSAALMAFVTALQTIPRVLFAGVTGIIADRWNRAKVITACDLLQAALVLPLLLVKTQDGLPIVYVVAFFLALLSTQGAVAKAPLIGSILPRNAVVKGNALLSGTESIIMMVGPAIGTFAIVSFGYTATFVGNAVSFILSGVLVIPLWRLHNARTSSPGTDDVRPPSVLSPVGGLVEALRSQGLLRQLLLIVGLLALGQGTVQALYTPLLMQVIGVTTQQYATIMTIQGIGGIVGSYLIIRLSERLSSRMLLGGGLLLASVTTALLVTYPTFWLVAIITLAEGVFITAIFISVPSLIQQHTADHMMGRAFATVEATEQGFMLLSMTLSGVLVSFIPMRVLFLGVAVMFVVGGWVAVRTLHAPKTLTA